MYLSRIELQGFKTFAAKTTLAFLPKKAMGHSPITAIVGPNGSGKSNLADAIRWAMGEQSLKLLRGKESTDIIFSGSAQKGRGGFAEVSLTFDNSDGAFPLETPEVSVTRRLYRDGESAYLLNNTPARLADIQLLLAESGVGQRSYSVIGQGMVDAILIASPEERKQFFDDATGVRPLQMKRHQAMLKLRHTYENLAETEMIMAEIEPRLRLLRRQRRRLDERAEVEQELIRVRENYLGGLWRELTAEWEVAKKDLDAAEKFAARLRQDVATLETSLSSLEKPGKAPDGLAELQRAYKDAQTLVQKAREERYRLEKEIELARVRAQASWAPLPLADILGELEEISKKFEKDLKSLKGLKSLEELKLLLPDIEKLHGQSEKLRKRLTRPAPEDVEVDKELAGKLTQTKKSIEEAEHERKRTEAALDAYASRAADERQALFAGERQLRETQHALHEAEAKEHEREIHVARLEERRVGARQEAEGELHDAAEAFLGRRDLPHNTSAEREKLRAELERLKYKLELIGGIDPETVAEFEQTEARFNHLEEQIKDLRAAMRDTEHVVDELDEKIHKQSEAAFRDINAHFQTYFKVLFGGGTCSLVKMTREEIAPTGSEHPEAEAHEGDVDASLAKMDSPALKELQARVKERADRTVGIDIHATPPGKKLKALALLSGGERALTSIALLAAIMATNPAPFVVLDEVDAALDEANTLRFAAILEELAKKTQYIVVTHNRATMEKADVLYGVTMNEDGVSQLLSVDLSDIAPTSATRR
ncbi:AAA family ATPase [Candidatus Uhrbacteria bacterium]|nr:AAA family ATPase [Candidatus Uhrbacteria bacterium]